MKRREFLTLSKRVGLSMIGLSLLSPLQRLRLLDGESLAQVLDLNLKLRSGSTLVSWSSLTGWAAEGAGSSLATESTTLPPYGGQAVRISNSNAGGIPQASNFSVGPFDLVNTNTILECPIYVPSDHIGGSFRVMLGSGGGFTNNYAKDVSSTKTLAGWNLYRFAISEMTATGTPNINAINAIRIRSVSPAGLVSYAIFGPIVARNVYQPHVILSYDDGLETVYTNAKPILDAYDMRGVVYCGYGSLFGPTTLKRNQLDTLRNAGWDISSHLYDQAPILTSGYTPVQQYHQLADNVRELGRYWGNSAKFLSWPGGEYDDSVLTMALQAGVEVGRSTQNVPIELSSQGLYHARQCGGWSFDSGSRTVSQVLADINLQVIRQQSCIWYGHNVVPAVTLTTDISIANMTAIVAELARLRDSGLLSVSTLSGWREKCLTGRVLRLS